MSEKNPLQIARFDSKGCLMEVIDAFNIGKVKINIAPYDTRSHKQTALNTFFLDFQDWFSLSQRIQLGTLLAECYNEKMQVENAKRMNQTYYMKDLFLRFSGTPASKLREQRPSGKDESRVLRVYPALKDGNVIFSIAKGDGQREGTGAIKPLFKAFINESQNGTIVTKMPVDYGELRGACQLIDMRIQAFIIQQQFAGLYKTQSQNENREGISNIPIQPENINTTYQTSDQGRKETIITDEMAFPQEQAEVIPIQQNQIQMQQYQTNTYYSQQPVNYFQPNQNYNQQEQWAN